MDTLLDDLRQAATIYAQGVERLKVVSDSFEQRGGAAVHGQDALQIVTLNNDIQLFMTPEREAIVSKYRSDVRDASAT